MKNDCSNRKINILTEIAGITIFILLGVLTAVFSVKCIDTFDYNFIKNHSFILKLTMVALSVCVTVIGIAFRKTDKNFIYRLTFTCLAFISICLLVVYLLKVTGFWNKIDSVESLRNYISGFGIYAVIVFILMQIFQVVVLPIPGVVAIGTGVALFGPFKGGVYSLIGIMLGTFIAYFIGRKLGYKVATFVAGKDNIDKGLELIKGKDKAVLTLMFLLPFFPDDILCFVSGLSSMSVRYFVIMVTISRIISTFTTAYSVNGNLIPYDTVGGLIVWGVLIIITALIAYFVYKYGDKLEMFLNKNKDKKN